MSQNRSYRSNAPSASPHHSVTLPAWSQILFPNNQPSFRSPNSQTLQPTTSPPEPSHQPSLNTASATHHPPLPVIFHWRCCDIDCNSKNEYHTTVHFTRSAFSGSYVPGYHLDHCRGCGQLACEKCMFLQVEAVSEGESEGKSDGEKGNDDVWERIGIWGDGRGRGSEVLEKTTNFE